MTRRLGIGLHVGLEGEGLGGGGFTLPLDIFDRETLAATRERSPY